jgi:hypothetical protein
MAPAKTLKGPKNPNPYCYPAILSDTRPPALQRQLTVKSLVRIRPAEPTTFRFKAKRFLAFN